jgi:hypothetical protein
MSLEKWAEHGWLKAEATSAQEIADLLRIVSRDLQDARVEAISEDRRFEAAFNAARTAANVALRASGYRAATQLGHHLRTVESLELTLQSDPKLIQKMRVFSKKRNATSYDSAGNVSSQELTEAIDVAEIPRHDIIAWLRENHPRSTDPSDSARPFASIIAACPFQPIALFLRYSYLDASPRLQGNRRFASRR